jgi:transcription elongation factor GreA
VEKSPTTDHGYQKLIKEITFLKNDERPQTVIELDIARSHGDLKENAEYHAAKEKLAFIDARLAELDDTLGRTTVLDPREYDHDKVRFGSTVTLVDIDNDEEFTYTIVGAFESNPDINLISFNSPMAKQLLGKEEGDEITLRLPSGSKDIEIVTVGFEEITFTIG